ncbi:MAG: biotin/lipoyl-binding protein [Deltaproteobacteria bacterium]|nr:biotin/lipoyl-binding protein [Deltaproteobacteria bacterium]
MMDWKTERRLRSLGPWAIFCFSLVGAFALHEAGHGTDRAVGFAEGEEISIGALYTGRVSQIAVDAGQEVTAGQVVAQLDTKAIDAQIQVVQAEYNRLEAEADAGRIGAQRSQTQDNDALESKRLALLREQAQLKSSREKLSILAAERSRIQDLVTQNLATGEELAELEMKYVSVKQDVAERPQSVALLRRQLQRAEQDASTVGDKGIHVVSLALERKLEVSKRKLEQLQEERNAYTLVAPVSGLVTLIHSYRGEVVTPGEVVVGMVGAQSSRVIACLSEDQALDIRRGDIATLWPRGDAMKLSGRVVTLGPLVDEVPIRCRQIPGRQTFGRHVTILLDNQSSLIPGQALSVKFNFSGTGSGTAQAKPQAQALTGMLSAMKVPDTLQALSRFEPSGILWHQASSRYLVVSDDTGFKSKREDSPWIFEMSNAGEVGMNPIAIQGDIQFSDLESIAPAEDGGIYLLSSQGHSRSGKRKTTRTQFIKIEQNESGFQAAAKQSLVSTIEAHGEAYLSSLGLPAGTRELEIEAMAAHQGALYLGLKSPLDAAGNAMIWKMEEPEAFLRTGNLSQENLSLWATVKVPAQSDAKAVAGGISELLFLPNGSLMIASTPSQGDGKPTGFLSYARQPKGGLMSLETVRTFKGHKPEGLSLSSNPGYVTVAFDAGNNTPHWVQVPWPK